MKYSTNNTKVASKPFITNELMYMIDTINKKGNDYEMGLLITCGFYTGLRYSDLMQIKWSDVLRDEFIITENKTKKRRKILVKGKFRALINYYYDVMKVYNTNSLLFASPINPNKGKAHQSMIRRFKKQVRLHTSLQTKYASFHSLRKSFGMAIWEKSGRKDSTLLLLSEIYNHDSVATTRAYIGLREEEKADVMDLIFFD